MIVWFRSFVRVSASISIPGFNGKPFFGHRNKNVPITSSTAREAFSGRPRDAQRPAWTSHGGCGGCRAKSSVINAVTILPRQALAGFNLKRGESLPILLRLARCPSRLSSFGRARRLSRLSLFQRAFENECKDRSLWRVQRARPTRVYADQPERVGEPSVRRCNNSKNPLAA